MRLQQYKKENIDDKKRWDEYLKSNDMLKAGIEIIRKIRKDGGDAWIVGGAVRDIILGNQIKDIDIATSHPMDKLGKLFKTHDVGKSRDFGIVVVVHKGYQFEIAQLRGETYTRPKTVRKILE